MTSFKVFPNLHVKRINEEQMYGIYNPLKNSVSFVDNNVMELLEKSDIINKESFCEKTDTTSKEFDDLLESGVIVDEKYNYNDNIDKIYKEYIDRGSNLSVSYMLTTTNCNLACKYCFIENEMENDYVKKEMTVKVASDSIDFLNKIPTNNNEVRINYYGGEPLLNFDAIKTSSERIKEIKNSIKFKKALVTNGTLINDDIAEYLVSNNFSVGISIDGYKELHDKMRVYRNGKGTFDDVLIGFEKLKVAGGNPGISCTVGSHNVKELSKVAEYFATSLNIKSMGFNILTTGGNNNIADVSIEESSRAIIDAFSVLREYGVYEDRIMRRVKSFVDEKIRFTDCAACGNQLVISPEGNVGVCHAYVGSNKYFFSSIYDDMNPMESETVKKWKSRTPFNKKMDECRNCSSVSLCGGGCAYEAENKTGSIFAADERYCTHSKDLLDWIIDDIYKNS